MKLLVSTVELANAPQNLLAQLPENPLTFIRENGGIVGFGQSAKLVAATGKNRFEDLSLQWKALVAEATITDPMQIPGTGLVAFGSFAFSDNSETPSVLIVPRMVLGLRDGRGWLTSIAVSGEADGNLSTAASDDELIWPTPTSYSPNEPIAFVSGAVSAEKFKSSVAEAVESITAHKLEKVVLARDLVAKLPSAFDIRPALVRLAESYPTCWVYSVDGTFGASPELLVRVSHGQVSARVLAGTAGRGTDPGVDQAIAAALASSEKNKNEHAFAVNSLVASLSPFCERVDADEKPFSLALPNLWHLASDVHGVLRAEASVLDLAAALHPTAAVAGTPTDIAREVIDELEGTDRGRYAGPVGWIGADGDGEWAIALRGAQISGRQIRAFAGCGIVAASDPAAELAETELKFRPIREALA
jgi:menaquinone-specific isochorismate synthase